MKKLLKSLIPLFALGCLVPLTNSCSKEDATSAFEAASYTDITQLSDDSAYINATNDNGADDDGIVVSPYHTLKVNGKDVPLYGTRTANGIHSFAYLFVKDNFVNLKVEITSSKKWRSIDVLPKSANVEATTADGITTTTITNYGSFSFAFNQKYSQPLTLMVYEKENFVLPEGYTLKELTAKQYTKDETRFVDEYTAYYFKAGHYLVNSIYLPSNSVFYFEPGVYLEDYATAANDYDSLFYSNSKRNIRVYGNPLVDYSCHNGGPAGYRSKGHFSFSSCEDFVFENVVSINPSSWCLCFTNCKRVEVKECMLFGYKTCSDGIMLSDCKDSYVHHNFVRTGDDAIEAKSTGQIGAENIIYEYNAVWSDKARCYGCIYESNNDMKNIIFKHNSVGFELADWGDGVGALAIVLGTNADVCWSDIHFEDIEIYYIKGRPIVFSMASTSELLNYRGGTAKDIYFKDIRVLCHDKPWSELIKIRVSNACTLGKIYISNLTYYLYKDEELKFTQEDVNSNVLSTIWTESSWNKNRNIVVE